MATKKRKAKVRRSNLGNLRAELKETKAALARLTELPKLENCSVLVTYGPGAIVVDGYGKPWHFDITEGVVRPVTRQVTDGCA